MQLTTLGSIQRLLRQLSPSQQGVNSQLESLNRDENSTHLRAKTAERGPHRERQWINPFDYEDRAHVQTDHAATTSAAQKTPVSDSFNYFLLKKIPA
ncbi:unnamed protein product [Schistocephalus solidus]|uniref:Uncharacterized protein n=1 Tax=Schistocephalus solidus TaxID=70667 RepID=A0A183SNT1_SCHSO|nr:unnamed protein product [Schistocephalus solidus]